MILDGETALLWYASNIALAILSAGCSMHALLNKREPRAAIGWVALCIFAPLIGPISYLLFGINRAYRPTMRRSDGIAITASNRFELFGDGVVRKPPAPCGGNAVAPILNASSAYDEMLSAIAAAQRSVWLSQYIFESHGIGETFIDALADAVERGLDVCVLLDRIGAWYSTGSTRRKLQRRGVRVAMFLPRSIRRFPPHLNLRNHRKLLLIDANRAFVGGMNIRNSYLERHDKRPATTRDTHFVMDGPVVRTLCEVFADDWAFVTGESLHAQETSGASTGRAKCRLTIDGPDNSADLLTLTLLTAISHAKRRIRIVMPYFLPPRELLSGLQVAAMRDVEIDILLPRRNNLTFVHWAMQHSLPELLRYGIRLHYQPGVFDHSKLITVDNTLSIIGSLNIDPRSLRLNFELAIEVWDDTLNRRLNAHIDTLLNKADNITLDYLHKQPRWVRLRNAVAWLGAPYL